MLQARASFFIRLTHCERQLNTYAPSCCAHVRRWRDVLPRHVRPASDSEPLGDDDGPLRDGMLQLDDDVPATDVSAFLPFAMSFP